MYALALAAILAVARAQKAGTLQSETHPRLSWSECTSSGCQNKNGEVVIDANWRWLHVGMPPSHLGSRELGIVINT